ncbi:hypothetical protein CCM_06852 [Cordyceps militaris CM01]|uniref:Uncharacterized protein n=2 Tax=Cordyceps militaris TaxID=73501 RepID=G3JL58_CORMM|nr:uncharacterized protein CCM_06852 [Cordyceps militaris CM01]ATY62610.1 hypothetical protein A9K55_008055 [Cordyceps militaris]EGX90432.1 hypothetical protein CCM_06852 [Cordyceps militaris CM01]
MCKFFFEVTMCPCGEAARCLGARLTEQVAIGGTLFHILSDPVHRSELCLRRRLRERGSLPSRDCFQTAAASRAGRVGDQISYIFTERPCSHCSMCSNYL